MQQQPLLVTSILDYAARYHGEAQIVSVSGDEPGRVDVSTYREVGQRARLCALALKRLDIRCAQAITSRPAHSPAAAAPLLAAAAGGSGGE